jgi:coenzyme F420 hydrogenase subunit beta
MRYALTLVCGGASDLRKSEEVLHRFRIRENELALFRYRGYGNPGPTRIETQDGRAFELTYQQLWEDESKWMIQPRCRICPDAIGLEADIAASDVWPGGSPVAEDDGFNGILVRTPRGLELYDAAVAAGVLKIEHAVTFADFDRYQPHQVRKRRAVWARLKPGSLREGPCPWSRISAWRTVRGRTLCGRISRSTAVHVIGLPGTAWRSPLSGQRRERRLSHGRNVSFRHHSRGQHLRGRYSR